MDRIRQYFLPEGLLDNFKIVSHISSGDEIHFYLEEKNVLPKKYQSEAAQSKDCLSEISIEDFPLRGKSVLLHIIRRHWILQKTWKIVKIDWNLIVKGTRTTNEFASFLNVSLDTHAVSTKRFGDYYKINGKNLQHHYKNHLNEFNGCCQKEHSQDWLLYGENLGKY